MANNTFFKRLLPHLIAIAAFLVLVSIYFSPSLSGKVLAQNDVLQARGAIQESLEYGKKSNEDILWSNSAFAGMPIWATYQSNVVGHFHKILISILPSPILLCFLAFISFYLLLLSFRGNVWLSFAGGVAFAFSTFTIISIEAGHVNKVFNIALMPGVFAGAVYVFRKQYWLGIALTAFFTALQIYYAHIQITYYLIYIILFYVIGQLVCHIMEKRINDFIKACAFLLIAAIIGIAPNFSKLWTLSEFGKSTTRGGSELATTKDKGGLDKEYALGWSNGQLEAFTILVPNFYGGSSHEELSTSSDAYKALIKQGASSAQAKEYVKAMPLYWGDQPFTSGPVYFGATVIFLFILGLFLIEGNIKWSLLIVTILSILLSMGKHFEVLTDFFFYNVPMYNKFRSVTMILSIAELTIPLLGFIALIKITNNEIDKEKAIKGIKIAAIISGGICLLFAVMGGAFFDFTSESDKQLPEWLSDALVQDRESALRSDSIRSLIYILLVAAILWAYVTDKIKDLVLYGGLILLISADLILVDKRYLSNSDFKAAKKNLEKKTFIATPADEMILSDPDPDYRVLNITQNPFTEAYTSYFHKSIGGYSGIKLARYQDLIENHIKNNNMNVLNMLNTKYFIIEDQQTKEARAQRNPNALGNAWFVSNYKVAKTPKEEIDALKDFNPATTAIVNEANVSEIKHLNLQGDSSAKIQLTNYHPNRLKYKSNATNEGLAIFSEIYYQPGWNAYIDNKLVPHFRANYILRAMVVPAGTHEIEFKFEPKSIFIGEKVSLAGSFILVLFIGFTLFKAFKSSEEVNSNESRNR